MIRWDDFFEIMKELNLLTGHATYEKTMKVIYERVKFYDKEDFKKLLNDNQFIADWTKRNTYYTLKQTLENYELLRREEELRKKKATDMAEDIAFWRKADKEVYKKCNRKCLSCKVTYCELITKEAIKAVRAMFNREKKFEEINRELSQQFEGWQDNFEPF